MSRPAELFPHPPPRFLYLLSQTPHHFVSLMSLWCHFVLYSLMLIFVWLKCECGLSRSSTQWMLTQDLRIKGLLPSLFFELWFIIKNNIESKHVMLWNNIESLKLIQIFCQTSFITPDESWCYGVIQKQNNSEANGICHCHPVQKLSSNQISKQWRFFSC